MSITQNLEMYHKNQIENIKKEKNPESKTKQIGNLVLDVGGHCISAIANLCQCSWRFVKRCYLIIKNDLPIVSNKHKCGRKKIIEKYIELIDDINSIMFDESYTDPHFQTEKVFTKLTVKEVKQRLINTGKYPEDFIGNSTLANLLNDLGYNLKKVKRNKPLKKIEQTDKIFANVKLKKQEALKEEETALISIDTKDKVIIGPYSRRGKSRFTVEACDHELTNRCLIPFGVLDLKSNQIYFYNFLHKPTSTAIVDCIKDYIKRNTQYKKIVILLDNGPDNSGIRTAFLKGLVDLVNETNKIIELVYYPPYHSKYNPIERVWARLEIYWNGFLLTTEEKCNNIMNNITWNNVKANSIIIDKEYEKGITFSKEVMNQYENINIFRNPNLKKWSIIFTPTPV